MYGLCIAWMIVCLIVWLLVSVFDCLFASLTVWCVAGVHGLGEAPWSWGCCSEASKRWWRLSREGADSLFEVMLCFCCCVIVVVWMLLCVIAVWGDGRDGGSVWKHPDIAEEHEQDLLLCWIEVGVVLCFACCFAVFVCLFAILLVWISYFVCSFFVRLLRFLVGLLVSMLVSGQLFEYN